MNTRLTTYFKVLSDDTRRHIVELLLQGETCGCTIIDKVDVSQPTLSYHLKTITEAGLATAKRDGNWIKHYINKDAITEMIHYLEELRDNEELSCSL